MAQFLDFLDIFNFIDRLEGVLSRFGNADWRGAAHRSGGAGVLAEFGRSVAGANAWTFHVSRTCGWTGADIESYLEKYGVIVWGRRVTSDQLHFSVKERQANWAEYLLMRRGIPLEGRTYNDLNRDYGRAHAPGDSPPAWADKPRRARRR